MSNEDFFFYVLILLIVGSSMEEVGGTADPAGNKKNNKLQLIRTLKRGRGMDADKDKENKDDYDLFPQATESVNFFEFEDWPLKYPECSSSKNPYLSPVDISTSDMTTVRNVQTLLVNSPALRPHTYTLSTSFTDDSNKVQLEALTIRLKGEDSLRDVTRISGLGSTSNRFFDSAILFFVDPNSAEELESQGRRFHTINGKKFPLEIMMTFKTNMGTDPTQIHVMVEIAKEENPAWFPLLQDYELLVAEISNEHCFGKQMKKDYAETYALALKNYNAAIAKQKQETRGSSYQELLIELEEIYSVVKNATRENIDKLKESINQYNQTFIKCTTAHVALQLSLQSQIDIVKNLQTTTENLRLNQQPYDQEVNQLAQSKRDLQVLEDKSADLLLCVQRNGTKMRKLRDERKKLKKLWETYKIGPEPHRLFTSVIQVKEKMVEMNKSAIAVAKVRETYEDALNELENANAMSQRSILLQTPFHISWLLPETGGHYFYNGSSPIPPCERRTHVIVMEKPITISEYQLELFQFIPSVNQNEAVWEPICERGGGSGFTRIIEGVELENMNKISDQVPPIQRLGDRKVYFNPKNLQYRSEDGIHMRSGLRKKLKMQTSAAG